MIPMPTATIRPIAIQIGATRLYRTPVCHSASETPTIRTKYQSETGE